MTFGVSLPEPPRIIQHTQEACWAACLASLVNAAVRGDASPWYGGEEGSIAPLDSRAVVAAVQAKEKAPGDLVDPVTASLDGMAWPRVASLFGASSASPYDTPMKILGLTDRLCRLLEQQNYVILMFTDPEWGVDARGNPLWHGRVLHEYQRDDQKSGKTYFRGMDPDKFRPPYIAEEVFMDQKYLVTWRHAVLVGPYR